ncbi:MAG: heparan-alpha-glucosaminide N-acetyltransferase domain-containing protein [Bacteroidota bacterium]
MSKETTIAKGRLISLDVLRGLTIAGMIIVNDPGSWGHVYGPLLHADWHGITPTDMVFPFFLYIVGVSIALAYSRRMQSQTPRPMMIRKIFRRSLTIFALGLFLWLFPQFDFGGIRFPGVLQRIALVFLACALLFLYTDWKMQLRIGIGLLLTYWLLLCAVPVPVDEVIRQALASGQVKAQAGLLDIGELQSLSDGWIAANLEPGTNLEAWLDRKLIPGRLWQYTWDPEGLLSTLPSIATGISGMLVGHLIRSKKLSQNQMLIWLFVAGFASYVLGCIWDWVFPINKNLWTSSYVLYTSGLATLSLAASIWFVDVLGKRNVLTWLGVVFGANAIVAYVLHGTLGNLFLINFGSEAQPLMIKSWFFEGLVGLGMAPKMSSLLWALTYTGICFLPVWWMYKKRVFVKI